jgi:hypothetical protein
VHKIARQPELEEEDCKSYSADVTEKIARIRVYQNWLSKTGKTFLKSIVLCYQSQDKAAIGMGSHTSEDLCSNFKINKHERWIGFEAEVDEKNVILNIAFLKWEQR